jgi:DamX protein
MLLVLPSENSLIQIAAMANVNILQDYIRDEQLGQQLWYIGLNVTEEIGMCC